MMKNSFLQFTGLYMTCAGVCIIKKWRMSCLYASKLRFPIVFPKINWNFAFAFDTLQLDLELLNLLFLLKLHPQGSQQFLKWKFKNNSKEHLKNILILSKNTSNNKNTITIDLKDFLKKLNLIITSNKYKHQQEQNYKSFSIIK